MNDRMYASGIKSTYAALLEMRAQMDGKTVVYLDAEPRNRDLPLFGPDRHPLRSGKTAAMVDPEWFEHIRVNLPVMPPAFQTDTDDDIADKARATVRLPRLTEAAQQSARDPQDLRITQKVAL